MRYAWSREINIQCHAAVIDVQMHVLLPPTIHTILMITVIWKLFWKLRTEVCVYIYVVHYLQGSV